MRGAMTARMQDEPMEWAKARDRLVLAVAQLKQAKLRSAKCKTCGKPHSLNVDAAEQMVLHRARQLAELIP